MQRLVTAFAEAARRVGLQNNTQKTEVLYQSAPHGILADQSEITVGGSALKVVKEFKYLCSTVTEDNRAGKEITNRIQNACVSFGKLSTRVWNRSAIKLETQSRVYKAMVLPAFLYSAETYTLYRAHFRKLEALQQRQLRQILKIKWDDYLSNVEMRTRAGLESVEATLAATQVRWTDHAVGLDDKQTSKFLLYGELSSDSCKGGEQRLGYKDVVK